MAFLRHTHISACCQGWALFGWDGVEQNISLFFAGTARAGAAAHLKSRSPVCAVQCPVCCGRPVDRPEGGHARDKSSSGVCARVLY